MAGPAERFIEPPIVDAHAHIFTRRMPFRDDAWIRPDYEYTVEQYVADLDRHGIAFGVIAPASLYGDYNDYTLEALSQHRRLRATLALGPDTDADTLRRYREQGVVGIRLQYKSDAVLPDWRDHGHSKFLNRLADNGMHVEVNASSAQLALLLPAVLGRGVAIVVDHFGLLRTPLGMEDEGFQALLRGVSAGGVWVKVSAGFRLAPDLRRAAAARLLAEAGPDRLLWGSDAPFVGKEGETSYALALQMFYALFDDAEVRRRISDTALKLMFC